VQAAVVNRNVLGAAGRITGNPELTVEVRRQHLFEGCAMSERDFSLFDCQKYRFVPAEAPLSQ
jgi:hypothetical protein